RQPRTPARPIPHRELPRPVCRPNTTHRPRRVDPRHHHRNRRSSRLELGAVPRTPLRRHHPGHPLRHELVEARHRLARRLPRHPVRGCRHQRRIHDGALLRRLHHQPPARRPARRKGLGRLRLRRGRPRTRARRPRPPPRATPLLLEERQVAPRHPHDGERRTRLLGTERLPHVRRPLARTAVLVSFAPATITAVRQETPGARTLTLAVDNWPGHRAGQHVDVRLTAEDGYTAVRSYSIASSAASGSLEITVDRLVDGEVSPYLVDIAEVGDRVEV